MANWIALAAMWAVLVTAAISDWKTGKIFNWLTVPVMLLGLAYWAVFGMVTNGPEAAIQGLQRAAISMAAGLAPLALIAAVGGIGGGDAKLIGAVGALCADWVCVLMIAFYGFLLAVVFAVIVMVRKRLVCQTLRRLFTAAVFLAASRRAPMPSDSPRIPMGAAFCLGGIMGGLEHLRLLRLPWTP